MDYVVLDLEWNQASDSRDARNRLLTFEIIEIGAVKLNLRTDQLLKGIHNFHPAV